MKIESAIVPRTLLHLQLEDEKFIQTYGEPLEFYIWNPQPPEVVLNIASSKENGFEDLEDILSKLILNSKAEPVITSGYRMPNDVLLAALLKISEVIE